MTPEAREEVVKASQNAPKTTANQNDVSVGVSAFFLFGHYSSYFDPELSQQSIELAIISCEQIG